MIVPYEDDPLADNTDTVEYKRNVNDLDYSNASEEQHIDTPHDNDKKPKGVYKSKDTHTPKNHSSKREKVVIQKHNSIPLLTRTDKDVVIEKHINDNLMHLFYKIFNKANIIFLLWFLAIYFICYFLIDVIFKKNIDDYSYQTRLSKMLDTVVLTFLLLFLITSYYTIPENEKKEMVENSFTKTKDFIDSNISIVYVLGFIILFYMIVYLFQIPMTYETKPLFIAIIENLAWILLMIILFVHFFKTIFELNMLDAIQSFFNWARLPFHSPPDTAKASAPSAKNVVPSVAKPVSRNVIIPTARSTSVSTTPTATFTSVSTTPSTVSDILNTLSSYFMTTPPTQDLTTNAPIDDYATTTNAPMTTTNAPIDDYATTTSAPIDDYATTTSAPITTTNAPTITTNAPTITTNAPTITTNAPTITTNASTITTNAPITTTNAPTITTNAPITTTNAPITTTNASTITTRNSNSSTSTSRTVTNSFVGSREGFTSFSYDGVDDANEHKSASYTNFTPLQKEATKKIVNPYKDFGTGEHITNQKNYTDLNKVQYHGKKENDVRLENKISTWNNQFMNKPIQLQSYTSLNMYKNM
jgi:hypothetical protein